MQQTALPVLRDVITYGTLLDHHLQVAVYTVKLTILDNQIHTNYWYR